MDSPLNPLFRPRSVAVVGASRSPRSVGGAVFRNLLRAGFCGPVYPVNPRAPFVQSIRAWPSLSSLPERPDLVVVAVPAADVPAVVREAASLKVPSAVVLTAGFGETGPEGRAAERDLREVARAHGMRLLGPNCLGVLNPDPAVRLDATFATTVPPHGNIAFASQSGAVGLAALDYAADLGIGFSAFASLGNKADISGNDILEHFEHEEATRVVLLYLESFGNPLKFREVAARVGRRKPIALVKSGRSGAGARAAGSHTGALSGPDAAITALCAQSGVIRADTLEQLFDVATLLAGQPLAEGRRVVVVTNAGGPGILAADALEANGLLCPPLSGSTQAALRGVLRDAASVQNPVDVLADTDAATYGRALALAAADPEVHAVLALYVPPITGDALAVATEIVRVAEATPKPVLGCFVGTFGVEEAQEALRRAHVPCYRFPEAPARALALATTYAEWRGEPNDTPGAVPSAPAAAKQVLLRARKALGNSGGWLEPALCEAFAEAWNLPLVASRRVDPTPEAAVAAASALGFPVVLKADVSGLVHKTEAKAVALRLSDAALVRKAAERMARLEPVAFLVQQEVTDGEEWLVGAVRDPSWGPLVTVGAGGIRTELIRDVHQRLAPLSARDLQALVETPRIGKTLRGWRRLPVGDEEALIHFVRTLANAACAHPEVSELEVNPVRVRAAGEGAVGLDLRIHLSPLHL